MQLRWWVLALIPAGSCLAGGCAEKSAPASGSVAGTALFDQVFRHIRSYSVDSLDDNRIYGMAASGMLEELGDPYAALVSDRDRRLESLDGPVQRLGMYLDRAGGRLTVVATIPGSPAVGHIEGGDAILRINKAPAGELAPEAAASLLEGPDGSTVILRVRHAGEQRPVEVTLTRGPVPAPPPPAGRMLDNGIAHLKFFSLAGEAGSQAVAAIDGLAAQRMRGLVLDLRGVAEGSFANGLRLADYFLRPGTTIVTSRGRRAGTTTKSVDSVPEPHPDLPLVVLVDRGTAGAAELVAGALQDHDRALVLGETTFGRGSVQTLFPMEDGYSLRLSTALWVTPAGRVIQQLPAPQNGSETDSVPARPKFKTDGGRIVQGGGGIVPDHSIRLTGANGADLGLAMARSLLERSTSPKALLTLALEH